MVFRGACRGCDWEGPVQGGENPAAEDACDHAWPGWRDLPPVSRPPSAGPGTSAAEREGVARWAEIAGLACSPGWLEAGGPIRTLRGPHETRHVPCRTPFGGYDLAAAER
jgi:hypothetical protein